MLLAEKTVKSDWCVPIRLLLVKKSVGLLLVKCLLFVSGGASSEAWIRVCMIAPVKKFGRARLSTDFLINKHGGDFM